MSLKMVDAPMVVAQLLNDEYVTSKTHGNKPLIKIIYNLKKLNPQLGGVYIYQISDVVAYNYSSRQRDDRDYIISIDLRFKSRKYMLSNLAHFREILEKNIVTIKDLVVTDTDYQNPFNRMYEKPGARDMSNRQTNFHRYVLDVRLEELGHVRAT